MSDVSNIGNVNALPSFFNEAPRLFSPTTRPSSSAIDTIEISPTGRALAGAAEKSSLRIARTRAIRAEIENGTYETLERIKGTASRLLDLLA